MKILEVNDNDIYGKIFNGYQIMEELNKDKSYSIKQMVINKLSTNPNVVTMFPTFDSINEDFYLHKLEHNIMSTHSLLSTSTLMLKNNKYYKNSDLVHFHQVHNCRFSLPTFFNMAKTKPTVVSFHDPWFMTGRCVHTLDCNKWENGCYNCNDLDTIFDLPYDNCSELWKIKSELANTDIDIIVHSKFMYDMAKKNPYTKNLRIHEIPLGVDMSKYEFKLSKEEAKKKLNIFPSDIVIFFREQQELKGTNYIVDALKKIENKSNITILTCSQTGLLKELENDYNIIELGIINEEDVLLCYNASDLFLMPSLSESFGMMAVEAMASGIPTIVFNNSALPYTTGAPDVGILVNNLDSNDLYEKINYYINNPEERITRGILSKKFVSEKYNYNEFFNKVSQVYESAYEKQKYKLKNRSLKNDKINYEDKNVKKLIYKLKTIYEKISKEKEIPVFLDKPCLADNKIIYSNPDVINLIEMFNKHMYLASKKNLLEFNYDYCNENNTDDDMNINNEFPKVSIIMPVYNGEHYVSLAIDSALRQTYKNIEIIVVNDGSTDNTEKVCKSFGDKIKYISKENGGVSTALNLGIKNMTGEYFSWLSHDDLYYPEKIEVEINYLKKHKLIGTNSILYSNFSLFDEYGKLLSNIVFDSNVLNKDSAFSLLKGGIDGLTLLIPKKAFEEVGLFDENLRCIQDYQLWFDMYKKGYKFIHIPNILAATRIHSKSVTNTSPKVVTEGNSFWIDAIKYFSDSQKIDLYGSVYNYYFDLYNFFNYGPYDKTIEYCKEKFEEIEKQNSEKLNSNKVSIIIPFHNNIPSVIKSVNSALNQTYKNIEIIIVNNASTDDMSSLKDIINNNENTVKYISLDKKGSISTAWNEGIKNSTGDYIAFLEQNNIFDCKKIENQLTKMVSSGDVISHTSYYNNYDHKPSYVNSGYQYGYILHSIINECYINLSTVMIYRPYLLDNNIMFKQDVPSAEDVCLYFEILKNNRILGIQEPLTIINNKLDSEKEIQKYNSIISYIFSNNYFDNFLDEKAKLLNQASSIISNEFNYNNSEEHNYELQRYEYMQSKEFIITSKFRKIIKKILFKKSTPVYSLNLYTLQNGRLNTLYRTLRKIYKKIRKRG